MSTIVSLSSAMLEQERATHMTHHEMTSTTRVVTQCNKWNLGFTNFWFSCICLCG